MRLADAIRQGSKNTPQCFNALFDFNGGTCALGAALKYAGLLNKFLTSGYTQAAETFPLLGKWVLYPCTDHFGWRDVTGRVIAHLNDEHKWSRQRIADWIEQVEIETFGEIKKETEVCNHA